LRSWIILFSGLCLILGVSACDTNDTPAATSAGFVHPTITAAPTKITPIIHPTDLPEPTGTALPTETVTESPTSIPHHSPTPTAISCQSGEIESQRLKSELLEAPLKYLVYLPPCYDLQTDRDYPVIYLFHGQTYSNTHWIDLGAVEIANRLISDGELAPFLMVFPYDRDHYDPPTINPFGEAVLTDLIPTIDQTYRTIPDRQHRAIGGISRGGNWAAHLGLQHPEMFGAIGLHSTPIFSTDTNPEIIDWLEVIPIDTFPRLFIDAGKNDRWLQFTLDFVDLIDQANLPHEWHLYPGFHEDVYWQAHLEQYIRWYAAPWSGEGSG
jgi:enterochelin esterase-like enzyme